MESRRFRGQLLSDRTGPWIWVGPILAFFTGAWSVVQLFFGTILKFPKRIELNWPIDLFIDSIIGTKLFSIAKNCKIVAITPMSTVNKIIFQ